MSRKITLLDGAVGTTLWNIAEAHGAEKVPVWIYNIEHPEFVDELVKSYRDVGCEIVLANSFGANGPAVKRSSSYSAAEVITAGVKIAKQALEGSDVKLSLALGPLTQLLEPYGDLT
ncbi:MAG: homocysteine S-methyltransferase family protein, partial [Clostridia bacterium]|nr:homocysteine S-methyltransferase family protein [Clostridia bacterium]